MAVNNISTVFRLIKEKESTGKIPIGSYKTDEDPIAHWRREGSFDVADHDQPHSIQIRIKIHMVAILVRLWGPQPSPHVQT